MNINAGRQIVTGVAGAGVRVGQYVTDGPIALTLVLANAGNGPCWDSGEVFLDYFPVGLGWTFADGTHFVAVVPNTPATAYGAGDDGQHWARYLADGQTGVTSSWGLKLPDAAWLGIGPALFVKANTGQSLSAYDLGAMGPRWTVPTPGGSIDFFALDADRVLWTDGARQIQTYGLPVPAQFESANFPSCFEALGQLWLVYARGTGGLVIRPWNDATHGFIVVPEGQNAFGPCVITGDDPKHVIALWGTNAAETEIRALTVDLTAPLQPIPVGPPPIVYPVIAPFTHAVSIAPFKDLDGTSGSDSEVVIDGASQAPGDRRLCWVGFDLDGGHTAILKAWTAGRLYGIAAEGFGPRGYDAARPLADRLFTRVAWWSDGIQVVAPPVGLNSWDQVWHEWYWYREQGETFSQAQVRWSRAFDLGLASRCHDLGGIPQYFTRGIFTDQETVNIIGASLSVFGNLTPRLTVIAPFEYDRINGITGNPAVHQMYDRLLAASVLGVPVFTPAWPVPPPRPSSSLLFPWS